MTQLTFRQRSAFVARQQRGSPDPSLSAHPASEGDAPGYMARVRREPHNGRRRHGSEQPESQRNIRPKAAANDPELPALSHVAPPPPASSGSSVSYRVIPPPPQLVTSQWALAPQTFADVRSPESLGSPESSTLGFNTLDSSSYASDRHRTLSPVDYTPTHSIASFDRSASQDAASAFIDGRKRSDSGSTNFLERTLHHGASICCF